MDIIDIAIAKILNGGGSGGGLPSGWATGTFTVTAETTKGDFEIEHGLGKMPHIVIVYCESEDVTASLVKGVIRFNSYEEYVEDEDLYYPSDANGRVLYMNTSGSALTDGTDGGAGMDTNKTIYIPGATQSSFYSTLKTYRWISIRLGA